MYYIVTGAAGFIGANQVKALNERGENNIIAVDNLKNADKFRNLTDCDIADYLEKEEFLGKLEAGYFDGLVTAVLHQGACSNTMESDGSYMMKNNYRYSLALLNYCQNEEVPYLYASSASVYGAGPSFKESREHESPLNVYAYSKLSRVADVLPAGTQPALAAYARARTNTPASVPIDAAGTVTDARDWGVDLLKLDAAVQKPVLHQIFTAEWFERLRDNAGYVDAFCRYVTTCAPLLHAHGGKEIRSFIAFVQEVGDPLAFRDVANVRNYHRFQQAVLVALRANQAGNSANKPLCLILHSAFDHNGAFHRDPEFTQVFAAGTNHTIMIEGAESLDAVSGLLPTIVERHGRSEPDPQDRAKPVKRIDQCMIAGHGSSQSIELAGTLGSASQIFVVVFGGDDRRIEGVIALHPQSRLIILLISTFVISPFL